MWDSHFDAIYFCICKVQRKTSPWSSLPQCLPLVWKWNWELLSRVGLFAALCTIQTMELSRSEYWSGSLSLLQGISPTQGLNPGLLHCGHILYQLSHKGSPRILEWVAYPFSRGSSWPRNWTRVSCIASGFLTNWAIREEFSCLNVSLI